MVIGPAPNFSSFASSPFAFETFKRGRLSSDETLPRISRGTPAACSKTANFRLDEPALKTRVAFAIPDLTPD